jgi:hypothetical protein
VAAEDANGSHQRFGYHLLTGPVCRSMFFRQSNHASGVQYHQQFVHTRRYGNE